MAPEFFDSHCHLDAEDFKADCAEVIARAKAAGVTRIVTIGAGYGAESAQRAIKIAAENEGVWASVGVHPNDAGTPRDPELLRTLAVQPKVVAIGETGFDFHYTHATREDQEWWFRNQIALAREVKKPLIIHCREAGSECLRLLTEENAQEIGGVFHCFAEDGEFAKKLLDINFLVSFPGVVTFKKADNIRAAAKSIPVSQIMIETDAPYLAPEPNRGKRCESAFVVRTAEYLAKLLEMPLSEFAAITTENAKRFYKVP